MTYRGVRLTIRPTNLLSSIAGVGPPQELIELEAATRLVLGRAATLDSEDVDLSGALGRTLAEDITSSEMVPGFDNSAMDGFAVRAADTGTASSSSGVRLLIVDESRAGS